MAQTGERYTTARAQLRPDAADAGGGLPGDVAHLARSPSRWPELIEPQERLVADRQRRHGNEHPDTIQARFRLAQYYRSAGRIDDQVRQFKQAAADTARLHAPEDARTLATADGLVAVYVRAGRWDDATAAAMRVLADREHTLARTIPGPSTCASVRRCTPRCATATWRRLAAHRTGARPWTPGGRGIRYAAARAAPDATPARRPDELAYLHAVVGRDVESLTLTADTPLHQRLAVDFILLSWRLADRPAHHRRVDPTDMHDPAAFRAAAGVPTPQADPGRRTCLDRLDGCPGVFLARLPGRARRRHERGRPRDGPDQPGRAPGCSRTARTMGLATWSAAVARVR